MSMPKVWSERELGGWRDCVYSSGLMLLVAGGKLDYPLGIYTDAEREALERSDDRADETGGNYATLDVAIARRYGVNLHRLADGSPAGVAAAMSVPGRAYAIAGHLSHFPAGHSLRRYSPTFTGFHSVCAIPLGGGVVRWLDPLALMGYSGENVTTAQLLTFTDYPNDARYLDAEELTAVTTLTIEPIPPETTWAAKAGTLYGYKLGAPAKAGTFDAGSGAHCDGVLSKIDPAPAGWPAAPFLRVTDGHFAGYFVAQRAVTFTRPDPWARIAAAKAALG